MKLSCIRGGFPADLLAELPEAETVAEVAARSENACLLLQDDAGALLGYAVFGLDLDGMLAVYAARALGGGWVARAAMAGLFGAAQVIGSPLRFHLDDWQGRMKAAARMMGADIAEGILDGDGVRQGVFRVL